MSFAKRGAYAAAVIVAASVLVIGLGTSAFASGHHRGDRHSGDHNGDRGGGILLHAPLAPSVTSDPTIFGVAAAGANWQLDQGHAELIQNGDLQVEVHGLVLTSSGKNPLPDVAASVLCGGTLAGTTAAEPFSSSGDAVLHASITLPSPCLAPVVVLNPATSATTVSTTKYIAIDGSA